MEIEVQMNMDNFTERKPLDKMSPKEVLIRALQTQQLQRPVNTELIRIFRPIRQAAQAPKSRV